MNALKAHAKFLWQLMNKKWDEAGKIQRRIDEAKVRNQEICRFSNYRTWY